MINGKHFRQALDKFFMSPVSGQTMDIKEINLLENRIVGDHETHRLVLVAEPERARMNKIIGKL